MTLSDKQLEQWEKNRDLLKEIEEGIKEFLKKNPKPSRKKIRKKVDNGKIRE